MAAREGFVQAQEILAPIFADVENVYTNDESQGIIFDLMEHCLTVIVAAGNAFSLANPSLGPEETPILFSNLRLTVNFFVRQVGACTPRERLGNILGRV